MNDNDEFSLNIEETDKKTGPGLVAGIKEKLSLKLVIIISAVLVLIVGGIAGFILFTGGESRPDEPEVTSEKKEKTAEATPEILFDDIVKLNVVEIKLRDLGGDKHFKVGVYCKIDQQDLRTELQQKETEVAEIISVIVKSKTYAELQGADGKILLRNEIIRYLNESLETGRVMNLYFYEFLIL